MPPDLGRSAAAAANTRQAAPTKPTSNESPTLSPTNTSNSPTLFATATVGAGTNQTVYALALCQGDLAPLSCFVCVDAAVRDGQLVCPFDMDMAMYKDSCHVRFSNQNFLAASINSSQQHAFFSSAPNLSSSTAGPFNSILTELLNATADYAVAISNTRFATGGMEVDPDYSDGQFANIYSTAQCTPDLTRVHAWWPWWRRVHAWWRPWRRCPSWSSLPIRRQQSLLASAAACVSTRFPF